MTGKVKNYVSEIYSYAKANSVDVGVAADKVRMNVTAADSKTFKVAEEFAKEHYFEIVERRKQGKRMNEILESLGESRAD